MKQLYIKSPLFIFFICWLSGSLMGQTYCASSGNTSYDTGITLVDFNTINNATPSDKTNGYNDFTLQQTDVIVGNAYDLTVNLNTDFGPFTVFAIAWIDWNHNFIFENSERYRLDSAFDTDDGPTDGSPFSISVPLDAVLGTTRMRVSAKWRKYSTSCDISFDGEVEDYTLNVISQIPTIDLAKAFNESCKGNDGVIQFYETTPVIDSGLDFSINDGASWQNSPVFPGLSADNYNLRIRNSGGGSNSINYPLTLGTSSVITAISDVKNENCGLSDGSINVTVSGGRSGSLQTDGSTGMVDLKSSFLNDLSQFTMEGWVKLIDDISTYTGQRSFFGQNDAIEFGFENGNYTCWTDGGGKVTTPISNYPNDKKWHHVAVVGTGTRLSLYIDGVVVKELNQSTSNYGSGVTDYSAKIGSGVWNEGDLTNPTRAVFTDVRFWNDARTIAEIHNNKDQNIKGDEQGLIAVYKMDTPPDGDNTYGIGPLATVATINSGASWIKSDPVYNYYWTGPGSFTSSNEDLIGLVSGTYDLIVSDLNGCSIAISVDVSVVSGFTVDLSSDKTEICEGESETLIVNSPVDYSMSFDGSNDYLSIVNSPDINLMSVDLRTIMLRFKPKDITSRQVLYEEGGGTHGISIYIEAEKINVVAWVNRSPWSVLSVDLSSTDIWYHYAFTWNEGGTLNQKAKAYLNGDLVSQANGGAAVPAHSGDIRIGNAGNTLSSIGAGNPFNGSVDNFRIWNIELSQAEIQAEMGTKSATKTGVIVDFDFDDSSDVVKVVDATGGNDATVLNGAVYESDYSVVWNDPTNGTSYSVVVNPLITTTYTATLTNENGCVSLANIELKVSPKPKPVGIFHE